MTTWTPATEPPKDSKPVLLTVESPSGEQRAVAIAAFINRWVYAEDLCPITVRTISWTPIPTPDMETP